MLVAGGTTGLFIRISTTALFIILANIPLWVPSKYTKRTLQIRDLQWQATYVVPLFSSQNTAAPSTNVGHTSVPKALHLILVGQQTPPRNGFTSTIQFFCVLVPAWVDLQPNWQIPRRYSVFTICFFGIIVAISLGYSEREPKLVPLIAAVMGSAGRHMELHSTGPFASPCRPTWPTSAG